MWLSRSSILAHWQTGRFLARRASLWLIMMFFKNQLQFCITHLWAKKTGRFLARRASMCIGWHNFCWETLASVFLYIKLADFWPEEHRCGRCCSKKFNFGSHPFSMHCCYFQQLPPAILKVHRWTQTAGQKSVVSTVMHARAYQDSLSLTWRWSYSQLLSSLTSNQASEPILTLRWTCSTINRSLGTIKCKKIRS